MRTSGRLFHANQVPHTSPIAEEEGGSASNDIHLTPAQATDRLPVSDVMALHAIVQDWEPSRTDWAPSSPRCRDDVRERTAARRLP